jgi:hypothetical protein
MYISCDFVLYSGSQDEAKQREHYRGKKKSIH